MAPLPLALVLLALALGVLPLAGTLQGTGLALLAAAGWAGWPLRLHRPGPRRLALLLALLLAFGWGHLQRPQPGPGDPVRLIGPGQEAAGVRLRGQLLADPQARLAAPNITQNQTAHTSPPARPAGACRVLLQLEQGRSELLFPHCPALRQGWRIEAAGRLQRPRPAPHPLLSGAAERLARQGAWSQLEVQQWRLLERPATPVADLRRRMAAALQACGGADAGGVLGALVLGSAVVPVPLAVREAFRAAGLSHALAASGFHLTVLMGAVMAVGRWASRPLRWGLALGAMGLFLLLAGPQPSVVRAVAMGALAFGVQESGRRVRPLGVLLLCLAVILAAAPAWLLDVGFQLSVAATAGLLLSAGPLERRLGAWLPGWAAAAIAVPLAASLWTLPLQLLHFGALPLYAVPANLLAAPLLTPLTLGAMALAVAAVLLPPLLAPLAWVLVPLTQLFIALARTTAALPLAQWQLGRLQPLPALLLALALLPWLLPLQGVRAGLRRWLRPGGALLLTAVIGLQIARLSADQLLVVQEGSRALVVARHQGRGALISRRADGLSCSRARQLALGLGLQRYDWVLLQDPVAAAEPACWRALTPTLLARMDASPALQVGQRLASPGLDVTPLSDDSEGLLLKAGHRRWALLPDRQAWWSWQRLKQHRVDGLWLGFRPNRQERQRLAAQPPRRLWLPAAGSSSGWHSA